MKNLTKEQISVLREIFIGIIKKRGGYWYYESTLSEPSNIIINRLISRAEKRGLKIEIINQFWRSGIIGNYRMSIPYWELRVGLIQTTTQRNKKGRQN